LYVLWAAFGFFSGFHLMALLCVPCPAPGRAGRWPVALALVGHFGSLLTFLTGGGICRAIVANSCPDGEEMSRECMLKEQIGAYQFFYVLHFMALAWLFAQWFADGLALWGWSRDGLRRNELTAFGIHTAERPAAAQRWARLRWQYAAIALCVLVITLLVWTINWSTEPPKGGDISVEGLGFILFPFMILFLVASNLILRLLVYRNT
jgi:hypothetical protein